MNPITIIIPAAGNAAGVAVVHAKGKYFLLTATNGTFRVLTSHGDEYSFSETNSGFGNDQSAVFGKLTFYNDTGGAVTITFYVSDSPIKTADVNVTSNVNVTATLKSDLVSSAEIVPGQFVKSTTVVAGPVTLAAAGTFATTIILFARKTLASVANGGIANAGNIEIGFAAANGAQPIEMLPGDVWSFSVSSGRKLDLGKIYLDVLTDNDGDVVIYY